MLSSEEEQRGYSSCSGSAKQEDECGFTPSSRGGDSVVHITLLDDTEEKHYFI